VLHTSGTTGRPKVVPLTHANLAHAAHHITAWFGLTPADRCLAVLPLFHISLFGAVVVPLWSGGSTLSLPGFDPAKLLDWMNELAPTWYSGVPVIHEAVKAALGRDAARGRTLRFVTTGGAAMPAAAAAALEDALAAAVIGVYGLSESSGLATCNPLPPRARQSGSVGVPVGQEVALMNDRGELLPAGAEGEVVLRGANVMRGYRGDPAANAAAFAGGWFRTGDVGRPLVAHRAIARADQPRRAEDRAGRSR
jgi:long-subunit acyl-CoA synthetase (AMP-forming)